MSEVEYVRLSVDMADLDYRPEKIREMIQRVNTETHEFVLMDRPTVPEWVDVQREEFEGVPVMHYRGYDCIKDRLVHRFDVTARPK